MTFSCLGIDIAKVKFTYESSLHESIRPPPPYLFEWKQKS